MPLEIIRRHKSRNWYLRGTVRGITVDETTGTDIWEKANEIRIKREAQLLENSIHGARKTATFLQAAVMYLEFGGESRYVEKIAKYFGSTKLDAINQTAIEVAAKKLYPRAGHSTLNRQVYTPVSAILKFAAKRELCSRFEIERPEQPPGRVKWITPKEADRLIECSAPHLKPLIIFLLYTGARLSEALYLDWREVDLSSSHVSFLDTKNGEARGVHLHRRVVVALGNISHRSGAVFLTNRGLPYARKDGERGGGQIKTAFAGACRRAGIEDFSPHDCRHTWATWHYKINRDLIALQKLGGWKTERMVLRYAHVNVETLAASQDRLPWGKSGDLENSEENLERKTK